jgi:hypothetical protein
MELSIYIQELRESLQAAAALGDEHSQRAAGAIAGAIEPAARLALIHALSDLAAEVTSQLQDGGDPATSVDVRLDGRDVKVGVTRARTTGAGDADPFRKEPAGSGPDHPGPDSAHRSFSDVSGDLTRTTVRMFNQLKAEAEKAASEQGLSLNSFISRAVADSIKTDIPRKWRGRPDGRHGGPGPAGGGESPSTISGYVQG